MRCKCGGELKRIAADCYQCKKCMIKAKCSIADLGVAPTTVTTTITYTTPMTINTNINYIPNMQEPDVRELAKKVREQFHKDLEMQINRYY